MLISIIAVIITFGLIVSLHEFGHFLACKGVGIKVNKFSLGFGPKICGFKKGDTEYSLRWIPLGGFVEPAGEMEESKDGGTPLPSGPDDYFSKPWYSRLTVVLAGPLVNYILAAVLFTSVILAVGQPVPSEQNIIGDISADMPADIAGLKPGDKIIKVDGKDISDWAGLSTAIHAIHDREIKLVYERNGEAGEVAVSPKLTAVGDEKMGLIGIGPEVVYKPMPFFKSVAMGTYQCWYWTELTVTTLWKNLVKMEKPDLAGPVGIIQVVNKAAHQSFSDFFFLMALISVAVGFFNLLPIPLVDGGQAVVFICEGIFRRRPSAKVMEYANTTGFIILIGIFVFATYSDIARIASARGARKAAAEQQQTTEQKAVAPTAPTQPSAE